MSNTAWTNLNSKGHVLSLHDLCGKDRCKGQKMICFTPKQFDREGSGLLKNNEKSFQRKSISMEFIS